MVQNPSMTNLQHNGCRRNEHEGLMVTRPHGEYAVINLKTYTSSQLS